MSIWDNDEDYFSPTAASRSRDVTKFGIRAPKLKGMNGRLYIPARLNAQVGQYVRYVKVPEGMAFRVGEKGDYKVCAQNSGTAILFAQAPYELCRFAKNRTISIEVEDFNGGYLCRYSQFE
jgi:hypothetical protein